jgi:hypothetical protein
VDVAGEIKSEGVVLLDAVLAGEEAVADDVVAGALGDRDSIVQGISGSSVDGVATEEGVVDGGVGDPKFVRGGQSSEHVEVEGVPSQHVGLASPVNFNTAEASNGGGKRDHHVDTKSGKEGIFARVGGRRSSVFTSDVRRIGRIGVYGISLDENVPRQQGDLGLVLETSVVAVSQGRVEGDGANGSDGSFFDF